MLKTLPGLVVLVGLFGLVTSGPAQEPSASPKMHRVVHAVRSGDAAVLAETLNKHFDGGATIQIAPAGAGHLLLIRGPETVTAEVVRLLEKLDPPHHDAKAIEIDVYLVDVFAKKGPFEKDAAETEWSGPTADILARLDELSKNSRIGSVQRFRLSTIDGKVVVTVTGGSKPIVSGPVVGRTGIAARSVTYHPVGVTLKATPRVESDGAVSLDLDLKDSRVRQAVAAGGAAGAAEEPAEILTGSLTSRVRVPAGRAVAAQAIRSEGKAGGTIALVIVTARVVGK